MYQTGEYVVYGKLGVCTVADCREREAPDSGVRQLYYTLVPCFEHGMKVYAPVDNNKVPIHPMLTEDQAQELLRLIPFIRGGGDRARDLDVLTEQCAARLSFSGREELIERLLILYGRRAAVQELRRRKGPGRMPAAREVRTALFNELGIALHVSAQEAARMAERAAQPAPACPGPAPAAVNE